MPDPIYILAPYRAFHDYLTNEHRSLARAVHIDSSQKLKGLRNVTIHLRGNWWDFEHLREIVDGELTWMVKGGFVRVEPDIFPGW